MTSKKTPLILSILLLPLALGCVVFYLFGHRLVSAMYHQQAAGFLNRMIEYRGEVPLETYLQKARIWAVIVGVSYGVMIVVGVLAWPRRRRLVRVVRAVVFVMLVATVAELTTRTFFGITGTDIEIYRHFSFDRTPDLLIRDDELGYKMRPNVTRNVLTSEFSVLYQTNELGLRDRPIEQPRSYRILFLGDSQTFGWGVPYGDRFTELIEQHLGRAQTINAGVPGYGIHRMKLLFERCGPHLKPDLVVCCISQVNLSRAVFARAPDVGEAHLRTGAARASGVVPDTSDPSQPSDGVPTFRGELANIGSDLLLRSYLYAFARARIGVALLRSKMAERDQEVWDRLAERNPETRGRSRRDIVQAVARQVFEEYRATSEGLGTTLLIANIDTRPLPEVREILATLEIDYVDISRDLGAVEGVRFKIDPHYNNVGHRRVAEYLGRHIAKQYGPDIAARAVE